MCNDLPSPSDWAVGSLAVGPKTKTIPNREVISGPFLKDQAGNNFPFFKTNQPTGASVKSG
jgi:hypothetical protein